MKAVVAAFNQEKALVGAFSVIVQLHRLIDLRHYSRYRTMCEDDIGDLGLSGGHHPGPLPAAHHPRQPLVPAHTVDTVFSVYII